MLRFFSAILILTGLATTGSAAMAQERVASNGPWTAQCRADRVNGRACEVQAVYDRRTPPLANYWLTYTLRDKLFSIVGAPCPSGGKMWIDKQSATEFGTCDARCNCQMSAADSARQFDLLRGGKSIFIEIKDPRGAVLGPFETKLRDFDKSYRAAVASATAR
jgi:invasion protein IalB